MQVAKKVAISLLTVGGCMCGSALADDHLSYTFLEVSYQYADLDDLDVDGNGYAVEGSVGIGDHFFVAASYSDLDFDRGVDTESYAIGVGVHFPLSDATDVVIDLAYLDAEASVSGSSVSVSDDGYGIGVGVRGRTYENWEVEAGVQYTNFDESDISGHLAARYFFTPQFSVGADLTIVDEAYTAGLGLRLTMP